VSRLAKHRLFLATLMAAALGAAAPPATADFLWAGANEPFLYLESNDVIRETLDAMADSDLRVLRIMIAYHFEPETVGVYDYGVLDRVDYLIQEARKRGVVLMIVFDTTYFLWPGNESSYLDYWTATEFFTEPMARVFYKSRIETILNHVHPLYGKPYKDIDDVIWAWELMNEPWIRDEFPEADISDSLKYEHMRSWHNEIAGHVKSIDPGTLVSLGIAGYSRYYGSECGDDIQTLGVIPDADVYTLHFYGGDLSAWIDDARVLTEPAGKLLFIEEFGTTRDAGMPAIQSHYTSVTGGCLSKECPWAFWRIGRSKAGTCWQIWTDDDVWWDPVDPMARTMWDTPTDQAWTVDAHVTACEAYWDRCEDLSLHGWSPSGDSGDAISVELSSEVVYEGDHALKCNFDPAHSGSSWAAFTANARTPYHWGLVDTLHLRVFNETYWTMDLTIWCTSGSGGDRDTLVSSCNLVPHTWVTLGSLPLDGITDRADITDLNVSIRGYTEPGALYLDAFQVSAPLEGEEIVEADSLVIESFESYSSSAALQQMWYEKPTDGGVIQSWDLSWNTPAGGEKCMQVNFDLNQSPWWGGVESSFDSPMDVSNYDGIQVAVRGTEGVHLTFQIADDAGSYANYDYLVCHPEWTFYHVPLDSFVGQYVNTGMLKRVAFFADWSGAAGGTFWVDEIGASDIRVLSVGREENLQSGTGLGRNFPNPFNPSTTIPFVLERPQMVSIAVYDIHGRRVRVLLEKALSAGVHQAVWDGRSDRGVGVTCGVYFCVMSTPGESYSSKMVLVR